MELHLKKGNKIDLPVKNRILFHLSNFSNYNPTWEVPEAMTQQGIANSILVSRCNVSRVMGRLVEEGMVEEMKEHIKGKQRKRKVYVLSTRGRLVLNEIILKYMKVVVDILDNDRVVTSTLGEVYLNNRPKDLCQKETYLMEILEALYDKGVFRFPDVSSGARRCHFCSKVPVFGYFIGRTEEERLIQKAIDRGEPVVITGIAGIGKTALAYHLAHDLSDMDIFWIRLFEWTTMHNFLKELGGFMQDGGDQRLETYLEEGNASDQRQLDEVVEIIVDYFQEADDLLMIMDDLHKLRPEIETSITTLLSMVLERLRTGTSGHINIIITTRNRSNTILKLGSPSRKVKEIYLSGLDAESVSLLLKRKAKSTVSSQEIFRITRGHPLALELMDSAHPGPETVSSGTELVQSQVRQYLFEEIFDKLDVREKEMLRNLSVYRQPVPYLWLLAGGGMEREILDRLVSHNFIEQFPRGYWIHDLIRSYFKEVASTEQFLEAHRLAAINYSNALGDIYDPGLCIELLVHLRDAREFVSMIDHLKIYGVKLIDGGVSENLFQILNELREEDLGGEGWKITVFLKGMAHQKMGHLSTSEDYLKYCVTLSDTDHSPIYRYKCLNTLSFIYISKGEWEMALDILKPLLGDRGILDGNDEGLKLEYAEALRHKGLIQWRQGSLKKAGVSFSEALVLVKDMGNTPVLINTLIDMGNLLKDRGRWEESLEHYYNAIEIAIRSDNLTGQMRGRLNAGAALVHLARFDEARQFFTTNLQLAKQTGSRRYSTWNSFNLAEVLVHFREYDEALILNREANLASQRANDVLALAYSYRVYGIIYRELSDYEGSLNYFLKCIEILEEIDAPYHLGESYLELGKYYVRTEDKKNAQNAFTHALELFERLGNMGYAERVRKLLSEQG